MRTAWLPPLANTLVVFRGTAPLQQLCVRRRIYLSWPPSQPRLPLPTRPPTAPRSRPPPPSRARRWRPVPRRATARRVPRSTRPATASPTASKTGAAMQRMPACRSSSSRPPAALADRRQIRGERFGIRARGGREPRQSGRLHERRVGRLVELRQQALADARGVQVAARPPSRGTRAPGGAIRPALGTRRRCRRPHRGSPSRACRASTPAWRGAPAPRDRCARGTRRRRETPRCPPPTPADARRTPRSRGAAT